MTIQLKRLPNVLLVVLENPYLLDKWLQKHDPSKDYKDEAIKLSGDNWRIVSTLSEVTEEWAISYVEKERFVTDELDLGFQNYLGGKYDWFGTALESFHSAIESDGWHLENPHYNEPVLKKLPSELHEHLKRHSEAQSRTLDPKLTLILEKI